MRSRLSWLERSSSDRWIPGFLPGLDNVRIVLEAYGAFICLKCYAEAKGSLIQAGCRLQVRSPALPSFLSQKCTKSGCLRSLAVREEINTGLAPRAI